MKTSEFIEIMEGYGYAVENYNNVLCFILEDVLMTIYTDEFGAIDTKWADFHKLDRYEQEDILEIAFTYIMTPVEEREEPKKYYLRLPNYWLSTRNYLNYSTDNKTYWLGAVDEGSCWKTEFTQEEIDNLPRQDFIKTLDRVPVNEEEN